MPETKRDVKRIISLYKECQRNTKNFTNLRPEILMEDPEKLLLFRLMLNMSQPEFGELISIDDANIPKYELGNIKHMQYKTAKRFIDRIVEKFTKVPLNEVVRRFEKFRKNSQGWFKAHEDENYLLKIRRLSAANALKSRPTVQEKKLSVILNEHGIRHNLNHLFDEERGIIVDFFIESKKPVVIECKYVTSERRSMLKEQAKRLACQAYKIKYHHKNVRVLALIESKLKLGLNNYQELQGPFDKVFEKKKDLLSYLTSYG